MSKMKKMLMVLILGLVASSCSEAAKSNQVILKETNVVVLSDEVSDQSVAKVLEEARALDMKLPKDEPIYLILNTPGGSIQAGLELIDVLKGMDRKVNTVTMFAASMGFQIAQNLDERLIVDSGTLMSHKAKGSMSGEFGGQEPSQLNNRLNLWTKRVLQLDMKTVERTKGKQTLESYTKAYENELWLTGQDSVAGGYADKVVTVKCNKTLNGTKNQDFYYFGMKITVVLSKCPMITGPLEIKMQIKTESGYVPLNEFRDKGGMFGTACMVERNKSAYSCPVDPSLTLEKIEEIKQSIVSRYSQDNMRNNAKKY